MKRIYLLALLLASSAALAQDIPNHSVPIGGGPGVVGWRSAGPCVVGQTLIYSGTSSDPGCSAIVTTGGSGILSATLAVNPLGTTSTTFVMGGVGSGCRITPNSTGRVLVILTGTISNSANGVLTSVGLRKVLVQHQSMALLPLAPLSAILPIHSPTQVLLMFSIQCHL